MIGHVLETLQLAEDTIADLLSAIGQHHATTQCNDDATWTLAQRHYNSLSKIRTVRRTVERVVTP